MDNTINSKALTITRWILFTPVALIQAGAFLEAEYITWLTGLIFCFFLTIHQEKVTKKIRVPYALMFTLFIGIFLIGSYIDIKN